MTLVPEGGVWNYGVGLTQSWSDKIAYNMTLDKPESFWAPCHRPVSPSLVYDGMCADDRTISSTLLLWREMMLRMLRTVWSRRKEWRNRDEIRFRGLGILSCLYKWATSTAWRIMHHHVQVLVWFPGCLYYCSFLVNMVYTFYYSTMSIYADQTPLNQTPQIIATNALTPIPALISPKPRRTSMVQGQPMSLSSAVPKTL